MAEVVAVLEEIETEAAQHLPLRRHDGVACFDYLYTIITNDVLGCVQEKAAAAAALAPGDPQFQDPAFIACLDVAFANRYLAAMQKGKAPPFQPKCWQVLLDHRETRDISPLIFAVAGVNAHVNFDLPFALLTACTVMGCELESGTNRADYQLINDIFANHMKRLREHFEGRFARGFDHAFISTLENLLGDAVVLVARDLAWIKARQLWRVHLDEDRVLRAARARDRWVALANWGLFQLDRLPAVASRGLRAVPGPTRGVAEGVLSRTGWGANAPAAGR